MAKSVLLCCCFFSITLKRGTEGKSQSILSPRLSRFLAIVVKCRVENPGGLKIQIHMNSHKWDSHSDCSFCKSARVHQSSILGHQS